MIKWAIWACDPRISVSDGGYIQSSIGKSYTKLKQIAGKMSCKHSDSRYIVMEYQDAKTTE